MSAEVVKDLLIIGAGPAGLKAAEEAKDSGLDYLVLEAGRIGEGWRSVGDKMRLLSPSHPQRDWTSLTYKYPIWKTDADRPYCTSGQFVKYLEAFSDYFQLNIQTHSKVTKVRFEKDQFKVFTADDDLFISRNLMVTTGIFGKPFIPDIPGIKDNPIVHHSTQYRGYKDFDKQRVLVVGSGNSAAEIVTNLAGRAMTFMISRGELMFFSETQNLKHIRGISESYLKELIKMEIVRYYPYQEITKVEDKRVYLKDRMLEVDQIIFATGYRPNIEFLQDLNLRTNRLSAPEITFAGESIQYPGLFFGGPLAFQTPTSVVIHGFIKDISLTVQRIKERVSNQPFQEESQEKISLKSSS